ncbi:SET domain-containing protein 3 [Tieghemiomyces parasiticus]|uniref:SET domain-containing protein 3 n=1 Tax=Tieghemiomyces parasiticus TaxID=78921 RepID=A0A9W7ZLB9_9FUNG|nr:SET domain-containing protein 3 [Tieghemiomyces parasiticus]
MTSRPPERLVPPPAGPAAPVVAAAPISPASPVVDTGEIRCICGFTEDDGFTIQCDSCLVWQHGVCVDVHPNAIPSQYYCERCVPRRARSRTSLPDITSKVLSPVSSDTLADGPGDASTTSAPGRANRFVGPDESGLAAGLQDRRKRPKTPRAASPAGGGGSSQPKLSLSLPRVSEYVTHHSYDPVKGCRLPDSNSDQHTNVIRLLDQVTTHRHRRTEAARHRSQTSPSSADVDPLTVDTIAPPGWDTTTTMDAETLRNPLYKVSARNLSRPAQDPTKRIGLIAESDIPVKRFIAECWGLLLLKSDYIRDLANDYAVLRTPKPFVEFHPHLDLAVDARTMGGKTRFLRRSCRPNAELRSVTLQGADGDDMVHLALFATVDIPRGAEITVAWSWDCTAAAPLSPASPTGQPPATLSKKQVRHLYRTFGNLPCACGSIKGCRINALLDRYSTQIAEETRSGTSPEPARRKAGRPPKSAALVPNGDTAILPRPSSRSQSTAHLGRASVSPRKRKASSASTDRQEAIRPSPSPAFSDARSPRGDPDGNMTIDHTQLAHQLNTSSEAAGALSREERKLRDTMALFERMEQKRTKDKHRQTSPPVVDRTVSGGGRRKRSRLDGPTGSPDHDGVDIDVDSISSPTSPDPRRARPGATDDIPAQLRCGLKKFYVQCYLARAAAAEVAKVKVEAHEVEKVEPGLSRSSDITEASVEVVASVPRPSSPVPEATVGPVEPPPPPTLPLTEPSSEAAMPVDEPVGSSDTESTIDIDSAEQQQQQPTIAVCHPPPTSPLLRSLSPVPLSATSPHLAAVASEAPRPLSPAPVVVSLEPSLPVLASTPAPSSLASMETDVAAPSPPESEAEVKPEENTPPPRKKLSLFEYQKRRSLKPNAEATSAQTTSPAVDEPRSSVKAPPVDKLADAKPKNVAEKPPAPPLKTRMSLKEYANLKRRVKTEDADLGDGSASANQADLDAVREELDSIVTRELSGIVAPDVLSRLSTPLPPVSTAEVATVATTTTTVSVADVPASSPVEPAAPADPYQLPELPVAQPPTSPLAKPSPQPLPLVLPVTTAPPEDSSEEGEVPEEADAPTTHRRGPGGSISRPTTPSTASGHGPFPLPESVPLSRRTSLQDSLNSRSWNGGTFPHRSPRESGDHLHPRDGGSPDRPGSHHHHHHPRGFHGPPGGDSFVPSRKPMSHHTGPGPLTPGFGGPGRINVGGHHPSAFGVGPPRINSNTRNVGPPFVPNRTQSYTNGDRLGSPPTVNGGGIGGAHRGYQPRHAHHIVHGSSSHKPPYHGGGSVVHIRNSSPGRPFSPGNPSSHPRHGRNRSPYYGKPGGNNGQPPPPPPY